MAYFHAALGSVKGGNKRVARRYAAAAVALDPFTLAQRKAKLLTRVFVADALVDLVRRALRHDDKLAEALVGPTARGRRA